MAEKFDNPNSIVQNALARNATYHATLKNIIDSVKPYMDKRLKGDTSWRYPNLVITVLRKVCDSATMSAGRYDGKHHRIYDVDCTRDGYRFTGNLICTGLLYTKDPDDVSSFDEYDMTLALSYAGKARNSVRNAKFKVGDRIEFYSTLDGWLPGVVAEVFDGGERYKVRDSIGAIAGRYTVDKQHIRSRNAANSVRSTNAVVAKALNAVVAMNAWADAPDAATAKRDIEQTVRKAADIAKIRSGAKATYKLTPNDNYWCGYIELTFNTEEEAKKYNPYYLFDELGDNKSILPKWSWAISSFNYQKNGKVVKIFVGRLAT